MNRPDGEPAPVDFSVAEDALVTRPLIEVDVRALKPGGHEFFAAIECGQTLEDATLAGAAIEGFDASQALVTLLTSGACLSPEYRCISGRCLCSRPRPYISNSGAVPAL